MDDSVLEQLNRAINTILNPASKPEARTEAHSICEACKQHEQSHLIGYTLASNVNHEPHVKHFGLQLMHNYVHTKWTKMDQTSQIQLKNNAISLIQNCLITESGYVKDGIAHVIVEIAEHVWPQNWPTMIGDLISYSSKGLIQTELVQLILLRLAEDVAVLQNIQVSHRSKDIRQGLSLSMGEIMQFLLTNLQTNYSKYLGLIANRNSTECQMHFHIVCSTLRCLQGYLEWAKIEQVSMQEGILLQLLCQMINDQTLQLYAADCLRLIVSRKGKIEDRKLILYLTNDEYVNIMVNSIKPMGNDEESAKHHYKFLKMLGEIFSGLAGQIIAHWYENQSDIGTKDCLTSLEDKRTFLDVLLAFFGHESRVIAYTVTMSWVQLARHKYIMHNPVLQSYVPKLLPIIKVHILKHSKSPPNMKLIEEQDFNDDEKLDQMYKASRSSAVELVRHLTKCLPLETLKFVLNWLQTILQTPVDNGIDPKTGVKREKPTVQSPVYVLWEAIFTAMDMTFSVLLDALDRRNEKDQFPAEMTEDLCIQILHFPSTDPLVWIALIHAAATFFHLLEAMPHNIAVIVQFLKVIVDIFKKTGVEEKTTAITSLRRQTSAILLRLCKTHPGLLNVTTEFKPLMLGLVNDNNVLSPTEKSALFECLVLVSREWKNFQQQSQLIGEIMTLEQDLWKVKDSEAIRDANKFAKAIGLCDSVQQNTSTTHFEGFRRSVSYCVVIISGMMSRSDVPADQSDCKAGGFINQNGEVVNPCSPHIAPVLDYIVSCLDVMHSTWTSGVLCTVHKDMMQALSMKHAERLSLLVQGPEQYNIPPPSDEETPTAKDQWEHIQTFLTCNLEQIYQVLGRAGGCLGSQFYSNPNLPPLVLNKMFKNLETLPELRLKSFIRQFLYPFFNQCPANLYQSVTCPILHHFCVFMNHRLKVNWVEYSVKEKTRLKVFDEGARQNEQDEEKEEDEIVKEQVLRLISREHLELVVNLCVQKKPSMAKRKIDRAAAIENQNGSHSNGGSPTNVADVKMGQSENNTLLTPLGLSVMESEGAETLLTTGLLAISWYDTTTVNKGIQVLWPVLKHTFDTMPCIPEEASKFIFESILLGLQRNGQHEGCQAQLLALGLLVWNKLRPAHVSLRQTLQQIPNADRRLLEEFDTNYSKFNEKRKKLCFKKLTSGIIEHHVGQRFKNDQSMSLLPRIFNERRTKHKPLSELEPQNLGLEYFFQPENI